MGYSFCPQPQPHPDKYRPDCKNGILFSSPAVLDSPRSGKDWPKLPETETHDTQMAGRPRRHRAWGGLQACLSRLAVLGQELWPRGRPVRKFVLVRGGVGDTRCGRGQHQRPNAGLGARAMQLHPQLLFCIRPQKDNT